MRHNDKSSNSGSGTVGGIIGAVLGGIVGGKTGRWTVGAGAATATTLKEAASTGSRFALWGAGLGALIGALVVQQLLSNSSSKRRRTTVTYTPRTSGTHETVNSAKHRDDEQVHSDIACPQCKKANPKHYFTCMYCGARLPRLEEK